jgi:hypothetical protein
MLLVAVILLLLCSVICAALASNQNRSPVLWFFMGFCFGILPLFALLIMAENENRNRPVASSPVLPQHRPVAKKNYTAVSSPKWPE